MRRGDDRSLVEFVDGLDTRFPRREKWIINVSTQFGCPIACSFCDAGHAFHGSLTAGEMLWQVRQVLLRHPGLELECGKLKVHFARMGEPAFNGAVLETLRALPRLIPSKNLWACVPTACPKNREEWFEGLLEVKEELYRGRFQLQLSLNTTDMEYRRTLMPVDLHGMEWMADYVARFFKPGDRRPVLNFALADGVPFDAGVIKRHFNPETAAVKLTPLNPTAKGNEGGMRTAMSLEARTAAEVEAEVQNLEDAGFIVILSAGDGREDEIGSNCGQSVRRMREQPQLIPASSP
jgi:23S rRNA (adenine2503-C2)-methyltransferase